MIIKHEVMTPDKQCDQYDEPDVQVGCDCGHRSFTVYRGEGNYKTIIKCIYCTASYVVHSG